MNNEKISTPLQITANILKTQTDRENESNRNFSLVKYNNYSRKDVHDIFDPQSPFSRGSGYWGLRGIISLPLNENDFVFFVTFGHIESGYPFDESVTESGILSWQSEPKQKLNDPTIQKLTQHNSKKNSIHLFLRSGKYRDYTYFGQLAYVNHNLKKEQPVNFLWQILDWNFTQQQADKIGLRLLSDDDPLVKSPNGKKIYIKEDSPELPSDPSSYDSESCDFMGSKVDYEARDRQNAKIGEAGELAVIEIEKDNLHEAGFSILIEKIKHVAKTRDGLGYDIRSITSTGEPKLIEVKTTTQGKNEPFFLTRTEIQRYKNSAKCYYLYRLFNFDESKNVVRYYILKGDLTDQISQDPIEFICYPKKNIEKEKPR
jgi:hypothetical protein